MFLQGNIVKVFLKIKVLKSQEVKCRCTYGVTLPTEYLQVAGWWQRWCLRIWCLWNSFRPSTTTPTCGDHRLHCCNFGVPTKETMQVTPRYTCNTSPEIFKIKNSYCDLRVFGAFLRCAAANHSVSNLPLRCVCVYDRLFMGTTGN